MGYFLNVIKIAAICLVLLLGAAPKSKTLEKLPQKSGVATGQERPAGGHMDFLEGFQDVPLLSGFQVLPSHQIIYDTAAGTIVQTVIEGTGSLPSAIEIYKKSLPALGWQCQMKAASLSCDKLDVTLMIRPHKISAKRQGLFLVSMPKKQAK